MKTEEAWSLLTTTVQSNEEEIGLDRAALILALTEYPELDIGQEIATLDSLAAGAARRLRDLQDPLSCVNVLSEYLFDEMGFRGNEDEYYDPRNSYLNDVLIRRLGIPISLSLVYIETGRRLGVPLLGIGMPGHFMVRHRDVEDLFVDPFYGGILMTEKECEARLRQVTQTNVIWGRKYLTPIGNREFITRMVRNLKGTYLRLQDYARTLRLMDWLLSIQPNAAQERGERGIVHYQLGNYVQALDDLRAYLASPSPIMNADTIRGLISRIEEITTE